MKKVNTVVHPEKMKKLFRMLGTVALEAYGSSAICSQVIVTQYLVATIRGQSHRRE